MLVPADVRLTVHLNAHVATRVTAIGGRHLSTLSTASSLVPGPSEPRTAGHPDLGN